MCLKNSRFYNFTLLICPENSQESSTSPHTCLNAINRKQVFTHIDPDIEILPMVESSQVILREFPPSHEFSLLKSGIIHWGFNYTHGVILQKVDDIHMSNSKVLHWRIEDTLTEERLEIQALLREEDVVRYYLLARVALGPSIC